MMVIMVIMILAVIILFMTEAATRVLANAIQENGAPKQMPASLHIVFSTECNGYAGGGKSTHHS